MTRQPPWVTTTTLLRDLRDYRNETVWSDFVDRFRPPIEAFVRRVGIVEDDRADVAQATLLAFATAYREGRYDRERGRLSSWLFGIAHHQALMHRRKHRRDADLEPLDDATAVVSVWEELWDRFVLERAVQQVRNEFSSETFAAFDLVVLQDVSPAEAADRLGAPIKQVYNAKHRVLQRMRERMAEFEEIEPGPEPT